MAFVLIVEDSEDTAPLEIALASRCRLESKVVTNGRAALKLLEHGSAGLAAIITDLNVPFVDGFDLISAIRSGDRHSAAPIIVITGDNELSVRTRVFELGANAFFAKPYSPAEVCRTLEDLLNAL